MPFSIKKNVMDKDGNNCKFGVINDETGQVLGCHPTKKGANDHLTALNTNATESIKIFTPLNEAAVKDNGTIDLKIIEPGWGSSGFYSREVLERDIPDVFPSGTLMFWNHRRGNDRPEGDLENVAAITQSEPVFKNGVLGEGVYVTAKVRENFKNAIDELSPHIGISIYAGGVVSEGEANGKKGRIVQSVEPLGGAQSIDFVTVPGAGGRIVTLFESVNIIMEDNKNMSENDKLIKALAEIAKLKEDNSTLVASLAESKAQVSTLKGSIALLEAGNIARQKVDSYELPAATKARIIESVLSSAKLEDGKLDKSLLNQRIEESAKNEQDYIAQILKETTGQVENAGESTQVAFDSSDMITAFQSLGLSEAQAKTAVNGRGGII